MHAHAIASSNYDAEIQEYPTLMFTSVLFIGIQLLRLETNCKIFLYHFYYLISIIINFFINYINLIPKTLEILKNSNLHID